MRDFLRFSVVFMFLVLCNIVFANLPTLMSEPAWAAMDRFATVLGYLASALLVYGLWETRRPINWLTQLLRRANSGREFADPLTEQIQASADALFFVADREDLCRTVLSKLKPKAVALLYSDVNKLRLVVAICQAAQVEVLAQVHVPDLENTGGSKRAALSHIDALVARFGIANVFVDVTGGIKPMALGLFMAAEERGIGSVYLASVWENGKRSDDDALKRYVFVSKGSVV